MAEEWLRSHLGVEEKTIKRACHLAMEAHKDPQKPFIVKRKCFSSKIIFAFPGTWSTGDWFYRGTSTKQFGETKVNLEVFPSIRSIGNAEIASVNNAFLRRFLSIMEKPALHNEVHASVLLHFQTLSHSTQLYWSSGSILSVIGFGKSECHLPHLHILISKTHPQPLPTRIPSPLFNFHL